MSKLILTDIDETIIEFANPFQEWAEARGYTGEGRLREGYRIEEWLGVDREVAVELMTEFGRDEQHWLTRAEPDALEVLPKLHAEGYRFVGITACGTDAVYAARRVGVIAEVFGFPFEGVHYVEHRASKKDILESFRPAIWVEDNYGHAVDGVRAGHRTFLLDRAYNQGPDLLGERYELVDFEGRTFRHQIDQGQKPLCRVATWHDIYAAIHRA